LYVLDTRIDNGELVKLGYIGNIEKAVVFDLSCYMTTLGDENVSKVSL